MQTSEGEKITRLLSANVDALMQKKKKAPEMEICDEEEPTMVEFGVDTKR